MRKKNLLIGKRSVNGELDLTPLFFCQTSDEGVPWVISWCLVLSRGRRPLMRIFSFCWHQTSMRIHSPPPESLLISWTFWKIQFWSIFRFFSPNFLHCYPLIIHTINFGVCWSNLYDFRGSWEHFLFFFVYYFANFYCFVAVLTKTL